MGFLEDLLQSATRRSRTSDEFKETVALLLCFCGCLGIILVFLIAAGLGVFYSCITGIFVGTASAAKSWFDGTRQGLVNQRETFHNGFVLTAEHLALQGPLTARVMEEKVLTVSLKENIFSKKNNALSVIANDDFEVTISKLGMTTGMNIVVANISGRGSQSTNAMSISCSKSDDNSSFCIHYTGKKPGTYNLAVKFRGSTIGQMNHVSFTVFPGPPDPQKSTFSLSSLHNISRPIRVFVHLQDCYGNTIDKVLAAYGVRIHGVTYDCGTQETLEFALELDVGSVNGIPGVYGNVYTQGSEGLFSLSLHLGQDRNSPQIGDGPKFFCVLSSNECESISSSVLGGRSTFVGQMDVNSAKLGLRKESVVNRTVSTGVGLFQKAIVPSTRRKDSEKSGPRYSEMTAGSSSDDVRVKVKVYISNQMMTIMHRPQPSKILGQVPGLGQGTGSILYLLRISENTSAKAVPEGVLISSPDLPHEITIITEKPAVLFYLIEQFRASGAPSDKGETSDEETFEKKIKRLRSSMKLESSWIHWMNIRRNHILRDGYNKLHSAGRGKLFGNIRISFKNEPGIDQGGVRREFWDVLVRKLFLESGLFVEGSVPEIYTPNPEAKKIPFFKGNHLNWFKFAGRMVAVILQKDINMPVHFPHSLYKRLLGAPINIFDLENDDPELFRSGVRYLIDNNINDAGLEMYFIVDVKKSSGGVKSVPLKPGGDKIKVTEANKYEYLDLLLNYKLGQYAASEIEAFVLGFDSAIAPWRSLIRNTLSPQDLELAICGLPNVTVEDFKRFARVALNNKEQTKWFWNVLGDFTADEFGKLLLFGTGTSKIPAAGMDRIQLHISTDHSVDKLPTASTCACRIYLPKQSKDEKLFENSYH